MSQIVVVDSRLPDPNDPVLFSTIKNLMETKAQAQEDAKFDIKRNEKFTNENQKKQTSKNISLYVRLILFFILAIFVGMIVRNYKVHKIIKFGLAGLFVYIILNTVHKLT
jgi:hypothetical protein